MCKDGDNCPYYLKGEDCTNGAHQISKIKFKQQISENIKIRKNLIKKKLRNVLIQGIISNKNWKKKGKNKQ